MTKATKKLLKRREAAWRRYKKVCSTPNYEEYKALRNKVCSAIQKDKANFQLQLVKSFRGNAKRFYGYVRSMQTVRTKVGALQKIDGGKTATYKETAEVLSAHFQDVFVSEIDTDDVTYDDAGTTAPLEIQFDEHVVLKKLNRLKPDKSQGPDEVHPMVLLRTADEVAKPLSIIFEASYRQGILPADWKCANISPIFKKGNKSDANNYRPVSLTSVPCKIMKSIIRDVLVTHMENNNLITAHQHGFMTGRSCLTNLLETLESWTRILDNGFGIDVIYLDYRKAFDTVPHNRLISKLQGCGIDGPLLQWIRAFLVDRSMRVMVNGSSSSWVNVSSGVPQRSVLGPLLFLIFVNDLPDWVKSSIKMFADDTKLWAMISNTADSRMLQDDLNRLKCWSDKWLLRFNPEKCKVMHVGHSVPTEYSLLEKDQSIKLAEVEEEKDLGIFITNDLKVAKQCKEAARKAMNVLRTVKRYFPKIDEPTLLILYKAYVRPHLEYCVQAWSPHFKKDIECLEQVQRRATKLINGFKNLSYENRLKRLKLTTLEKRRLRGDLIETFKIITGREKVDKREFFEISNNTHNLRGHQYKLSVKRKRLTIRSTFFSQRVIDSWNRLPEAVVNATSINAFKNRLDRCNEWGN